MTDPIRNLVNHLSPLHQAHCDLVAALAAERPRLITSEPHADKDDLVRRENHLRNVTGIYARYVRAVIQDTNQHLVLDEWITELPFVTTVFRQANELLYQPMGEAARAAAAAEAHEFSS